MYFGLNETIHEEEQIVFDETKTHLTSGRDKCVKEMQNFLYHVSKVSKTLICQGDLGDDIAKDKPDLKLSSWPGVEYAFMHMNQPITYYCYNISSSTITLLLPGDCL